MTGNGVETRPSSVVKTPPSSVSPHIRTTCLIFTLLTVCAPAWAEIYTVDQVVSAIYWAEGGSRAVKPFGILSVPCGGLEDCRKVCVNTVENNWHRWDAKGRPGSYLEYLARVYAPLGARNDPRDFNKNWLKNVLYFLRNPKHEKMG